MHSSANSTSFSSNYIKFPCCAFIIHTIVAQKKHFILDFMHEEGKNYLIKENENNF